MTFTVTVPLWAFWIAGTLGVLAAIAFIVYVVLLHYVTRIVAKAVTKPWQ